ncbi:sodium/pantothenate symporter [Escherichia coli]
MQLEVILPLVAYLVVVFGISVYAMRKRSTGTFLNEYFLGSRSMGGIVLAMTLTATYISASSFIGGPGAAYKYGLGWVLLAMIQLPAVWLSLGILGKKFAILARRYNAVTLNDMLFARYQSRLLVWLASLSLLVAFVGAMTVQFIGGARLLETAAGIPYETGLLIFGISIALYTAFGGFRASVLNDTMQGLVMLIGTVVLLIGVVHAAGGLSNAVQTLQTIDPQLVTPQGADDILSPAFMTSFWVLVCFGVIGLPHTAVRLIPYKESKAVHWVALWGRGLFRVDGRAVHGGGCIADEDSKAVHRGIIIGTIVVAILMFGMHLAGALGRAVIPDLTVPDLVIPTLMVKVLPPFAAGIFLAAPMAAIMSTINAQLLQSSATIIKDLYLNIRPDQMQNETRLKRMSAVITLVLGALLLLAAWKPPEMIIWLNLLAFGGLEAVFLWPLVLGLYWERANAKGALSAMIVGGVLYAVLATLNIQYLGFHPIVPSLLLSLLAFLVGNRFGTSVPQATVLTTDK